MIRNIMKTALPLLCVLGFSLGCGSDRESGVKSGAADGSMKCGSGKCGANMFDGNALLVKKKANVVMQMREDDPRRDCVAKAESTAALYACVRSPESGKLTTKCGAISKENTMKCGTGKCGSQ